MAVEVQPQARRFSAQEYASMEKLGLFQNERLELIGGEILKVSPQDPLHRNCIVYLNTYFVRTFGSTHLVQVQLPLSIGADSEPEPDFSLIPPEVMEQTVRHPVCPDLVIEASLSTLTFDRETKASLYASARIPEYWILNLVDFCLEVFTQPKPLEGAPFGWVYCQRRILSSQDSIEPVVLRPPIPVAALFDWPRP